MGAAPQRSHVLAGPVAGDLARRVLTRVAPLADQLVTTIEESNPGYRSTRVVPSDDLWRSCHDNLTRILQLVGGTEAYHGQEYDAARATGQRRAEQGLPIDDLLRSFRMGGRLVWEALVAEARDQDIDDDGLLDVGTRVWEVVDRTSSQVAAAYHDAERLAVRADEQRRTSIWEGLLSGVAEDPGFAFEAARMLEVPVDGRYVVVVAEPASRDTGAVRRLRDRLAGARVVSTWQVRGAALVGLVLVVGEAPDRELDALRSVLEVRGGVSPPVDGLARVPVGFRQAALALRTLGPSDTVACLDDRLPEAMLLQSPELAQQLVRTWLGSLLDLPEPERGPLLATLHAWVETAGSAGRTAELVHCHRNTVLNRLRRLSEATGRDLTTGTMPVELVLALRAHRLLGPAE
ncbi:helix-turn-helix domain-containing protein [Nocardioides panacis]|uniref:Helix-turn-helix domain-containing protein n=1 Tax=Nocardioides panacis TaxID=2849501 RepID=A0A975SX25_9ACTN|nr:helix-turn-helix domain-containing protein [Nocardioides panacis]QWZ07525.1 helix-turn-helix domain-containing protein [Nocardioides panacis]